MADETLLEFPCELPIKVFGRNAPGFRDAVVAIVSAHYGAAVAVREQPSRHSAFLALTITVRATSKAEVDALYRDLSASDRVLMVL